jgi:uncharacterized protein YciI
MLFLMIGLLKPNVNAIPQDVEQLTNDFIGQPLVAIRTAGVLRNAAGERVGMMILIELEDQAAAEQFMCESPFLQADLYKDVKVLGFTPEVGW